jgi:hypothetical protein
MLTEVFQEELQRLGLPSEDIRWRLSSSQGDGVAFYGQLDLDDYLKANKLVGRYKGLKPVLDDIRVTIEKHRELHMYDHYNTMVVDLDAYGLDLTAKQERLLEDLEAEIKDRIVDVSHKLEKIGYDEIEWRTSDEAIAETLEANEYEYDAAGARI